LSDPSISNREGPADADSEALAGADFRDDERLRKAERLLEREEFLATRRARNRASSGRFAVYARANGRRHARLGITASTKVGPATERNWWKRRIREIFRRNKRRYPAGYDLVVIVRPSAGRTSIDDFRDELIELFEDAIARAQS